MKNLFVLVRPGSTDTRPSMLWIIFNEEGEALEQGVSATIGLANIHSGLGAHRPDLTTKYGPHKLIDCNNVPHQARAAYEAVIPKTQEAFDAFRVSEAIKDS